MLRSIVNQLRKGHTVDEYVGKNHELIFDDDTADFYVHDGFTPGGRKITEDDSVNIIQYLVDNNLFGGFIRQVATTSGPIFPDTTYLAFTGTNGGTLTLPPAEEGKKISIYDEGNNSTSHPIYIVPSAGDTIDFPAFSRIAEDSTNMEFLYTGGKWRILNRKQITSLSVVRSDIIRVVDPSVTEYSVTQNGVPLTLNNKFIQVYINRSLLRDYEVSYINDKMTLINVDYDYEDEIEVIIISS